MKIDISLNEANRKKIAEELSKLLADTYTLYLKTQNFHWNVTGPMFHSHHVLFEKLYTELAEAVDVIAERIRALGFPAPASFAQFAKLTSIKESINPPSAEEMIKQLVTDQETLVRTARAIFPHADEVNDEVTADLLTERLAAHEKNAWMLRSCLA